MKFEMEFGWIGSEKVTVETHDFEKIQVIQEFIQFQEEHGWAVEYEAIDCDEDGFEEETEEEEIPPFALNTHEPL
jgi:hypothetical protein